MITNTSAAEITSDLPDVKDVFASYDRAASRSIVSGNEQKLLLIDLAVRLQMSLDINWVVKQFMDIIFSYLPFDGYRYQFDEIDVVYKQGRQSGHRFSYNLKVGDYQLGTLRVFRGKKFSVSELDLFENLVFSLLYPLKNSIQFYRANLSASSDPLTGINNRSTFNASMEREISLARRKSQGLSLLVIDIDHFKDVNDRFGHVAGDEVLKSVAATLRSCVRNSDLLFRYGGEEFVAILNDSNCDDALEVAERLLTSIKEKPVSYQDENISITVSIGISCLSTKQDVAENLFNRADTALYEAKNRGRDQVRVITA